MARREAAIMVRIDNMDDLRTEGSRAIRFELTEVGPQTVDEFVASALRLVTESDLLDAAGKLTGWSAS
jgi:hypothetical protein